MNQVILVGRLTKELEAKELENEKKEVIATLAVSRQFKNKDGIYETDFIPCVLWNGIAQNVNEYCHKGDVIGVRGRLQTNEDGQVVIIAEKVTFLSAKKED